MYIYLSIFDIYMEIYLNVEKCKVKESQILLRTQNLTVSSLGHAPSLPKTSLNSVEYFCLILLTNKKKLANENKMYNQHQSLLLNVIHSNDLRAEDWEMTPLYCNEL